MASSPEAFVLEGRDDRHREGVSPTSGRPGWTEVPRPPVLSMAWGRRSVAAALVVVLAAACTADGSADRSPSPTTGAPPTSGTSSEGCPAAPASCTLREAAEQAGVRMGVALPASRLDDREATALVAREFSSLTPENEMKWTVVQPEPGRFELGPADRLVAFAEEHGLEVRGHTLAWGQAVGNGLPPWVEALDDPAAVEAALAGHIATTVGRYRGRVARWDVVNEPLAIAGPGLDDNVFLRSMGPGYVARAFELAHAADPDAELWINEHSVESVPAKAEALVALVEELVAGGVPLHGVGLQTHLFGGRAPEPGVLGDLVRRFRALDLEVAITELDLPLAPRDGPVPEGAVADVEAQAEGYAQVVAECLDAGCTEVTVWGLDDGATWLDRFMGRSDTDPLLFDQDLRPKPAHAAVRDALLSAAG